jgi:hypothetical protein
LPVVLNGCETWLLISKEERRLKVFGNRVLRRIFWPKNDKVTRKWRRLHNEELYVLYSLPNTVPVISSRGMRLSGYVARMGATSGVYRVSVEKTDGRGSPGRPRREWEDIIQMDFQNVNWDHGINRSGSG